MLTDLQPQKPIETIRADITQEEFESALEKAKEAAFGSEGLPLNTIDNLSVRFHYHGRGHTEECVLPVALEIAEKRGYSLKRRLLIGIAAAFHDSGYFMQYNNNEPQGANTAIKYMKAQDPKKTFFSQEDYDTVKEAIMATDISKGFKSNPSTEEGKILRDADLSYFGLPWEKFIKWNQALRKEAIDNEESPLHAVAKSDRLNEEDSSLQAVTISGEMKWIESSIAFMTAHKWYTDEAEKMFNDNKKENIRKLQEELDRLKKLPREVSTS